jgi:hypothetical protein
MDVLNVYQTVGNRGGILTAPLFADGAGQWLGDGYYFWQDREFAMAWGFGKKCKDSKNFGNKFDVYTSELRFEDINEEMIDTVFNKEDYESFVSSIERFARMYSQKNKGAKPTLEQFNNFTHDFNIWKGVKALRFQDLPADDSKDFLAVRGFYYKKRIQIVVYDRHIIHNFKFYLQKECQ